MLLRGTEFCEYSKTTSRLFLQDVEDGYFPSELQLEYPEGVPFDVRTLFPHFVVPFRVTRLGFLIAQVTDKRNELYKPQSVVQHFQGKGNRLGSGFEDKPASVVFLEPMKEYKSHGSSTTLLSDSRDKAFSSIKLKPKKRTKFQVSWQRHRLTSVASISHDRVLLFFRTMRRTTCIVSRPEAVTGHRQSIR